MSITCIHNVTDVTEPIGRRLKLFGVHIPPGGMLRIPSDRLVSRPVKDLLDKLVAANVIYVGDLLPPWYLQAKQAERDRRKQAQAFRPRPRLAEAAPAEEPAPEPEAEEPKKATKKSSKKKATKKKTKKSTK